MQELLSNKKIAEQIEKMMHSQRMGHAFLFVGGSSKSREELGLWLCEKVLCRDELSEIKFQHGNHEDFILIEKPDDKETILVSQIEELVDKLQFKPFGSCYSVLIKEAHLMNQAAQNKLLKTLEEPTTETVLVLLSERLDAILPTVQSRCNSYILEDEKNDAGDAVKATADVFIAQIKKKGPYYRKKAVLSEIIADKDSSRQRALEFVDILEEALAMELRSGADDIDLLSNAIEQAEAGRKYLKQGHSVAYTLKQMCLRV